MILGAAAAHAGTLRAAGSTSHSVWGGINAAVGRQQEDAFIYL